ELNYAPSIWLNVRGRDPRGTIAPGAEYENALRDLSAELRAWRHPVTNAPIVAAVHRRDALYHGPAVGEAPDLILELALENGYSYACLPSTPGAQRSVRPLAPHEYRAG